MMGMFICSDLAKSPIMMRGVQLVNGRLDLVAFQLNTLDLSESNPVKNIVWLSKGTLNDSVRN